MTMTLDEAIKHCEDVAKSNRNEVERGAWEKDSLTEQRCISCAEEYEQLAEWLKELKDYREGSRTCENCKHEHKAETEYPCSICRCNHPNKFEWKDGAK